MPAVMSLTMTYEALNESGTFSEGDEIRGEVRLVLSKGTEVQSLYVKSKGDAEVCWSKKTGDRNRMYSAHKRYFKLKQFLIPEDSTDNLIPQGTHVYKFRLNIPKRGMPSSYRGTHGKIVYKLVTVLSRSWRMDQTVTKEIQFATKCFPYLQSLMTQQVNSTNKGMGLFSKGHVHMDATVDRRAYAPGDEVTIIAKINNSSTSEMTPKFSLIQDVVYRAEGSTKHESDVIHKFVDSSIKPQTRKEVKCVFRIRHGQTQTIENCEIISLKYHIKVYLDISFAFDPEITFPVIILPPGLARGPQPSVCAGPYPARATGSPRNSNFPASAVSMGPYPPGSPQRGGGVGPYSAGATGGPSNSNFPVPAVSMGPCPPISPQRGGGAGPYPAGATGGFPGPGMSMGPYPLSPHSGSYEYPGAQRYSAPQPAYPDEPPMYSSQPDAAPPPYMSGGYNNRVPPMASPYGSPFSSSSSTSVLHPPPPPPTYHPPPSAPELQPPPSSTFNISPTAPTYSVLPSAPTMNVDFLSQSDQPPPAYSLLFPSSATENSDANNRMNP